MGNGYVKFKNETIGEEVVGILMLETGKDWTYETVQCQKNNQTMDGIQFGVKGEDVRIIAYPEGTDLDTVVKDVAEIVLNAYRSGEKQVAENREFLHWPVNIHMYQKKGNEHLLKFVHREVADLLILPVLECNANGYIQHAKITEGVLELLHRTEEELFEEGFKNLENSVQIWDIGAAISSIEGKMLGVYQNTQSYGAATILTKSVQDRLAKEFPDGYYILPSSVHEVICADKSLSLERAKATVVEANRNRDIIPETDVLSDSVYELINGKLTVVA